MVRQHDDTIRAWFKVQLPSSGVHAEFTVKEIWGDSVPDSAAAEESLGERVIQCFTSRVPLVVDDINLRTVFCCRRTILLFSACAVSAVSSMLCFPSRLARLRLLVCLFHLA
ncbi:hypothetical protein BRADI_3g32246v3 [Brachypodium distachyon]|uniref:Uncharacterized protein n=1 Tax=Brachypodium distachyon TaxID=15368 RepID=A0A2K2D0I6_BRADI|nr:hypothetical protein BRADI_3g32246v3 [Brachypodium distachyon]